MELPFVYLLIFRFRYFRSSMTMVKIVEYGNINFVVIGTHIKMATLGVQRNSTSQKVRYGITLYECVSFLVGRMCVDSEHYCTLYLPGCEANKQGLPQSVPGRL